MAEDVTPLPGGEEPKFPSVTDLLNKAQSDLATSHIKAENPYGEAKMTPYPSESMGFSDYYGRSAYKRLGFNPYEDNRLNYSQNTSTWEKIKDTGTSFMNMTMDNMSVFGLGGHEQGQYAAEKYERQAALSAPIGDNSTFGWFLKQVGQAGYTASIITSIAAEEVLLALGTAATEGALAEAAWARTAQNFNRLMRLGDKLGDTKKAKQVYDATDFAKTTASRVKEMEELNDVNRARTLWNKLKGTKDILDKTAKVVAPHATDFVKGMASADSQLNRMNGFAKAFQGFGAFYREIREFNLAFGEAGLEKAFVEKDAMQRLTEAYKQKHGKEPEGADLERIQKMAQTSGASTYWMNTGLIYTTNKIGLGMLFGKYAPILSKENITNTKFGQYYVNKANLKKGRFASSDFIKSGMWNRTKDVFKKSTLKKDPMRGVRYAADWLATGASEGTQEYFQEVIQDAEVKRAENEFMKGSRGNMWDVYATSMNKLLSPEGAEVFMSGFLMGGIATPYRVGIEQLTNGVTAATDYMSGNYSSNKEYKRKTQEAYAERVKKETDMFRNAWAKDVGLGGLSKYENYMELKQKQDEAIEQEDEKSFRDIKDQATLEFINYSIENNTFDTVMDQMEQVERLSDEEIASTFEDQLGDNPTKEQIDAFREDTRQIVDKAKTIKKMKESIDSQFKNPFSYATNDDEEDTTFGLNNRGMYMAYESAKKTILHNQYSYNRTLERMDKIMQSVASNPPFWNKQRKGPASDYTVLFNVRDLTEEIDLLKRETKDLNQATGLSAAQIRDKKEKISKLEKLTEFKTLVQALQQEYKNEQTFVDANIGSQGSEVKINTRAGGTGTIVDVSSKKYKIRRSDTGRVYWINKESVDVTKASSETSDKVVKELYKSYEKYMKDLAKQHDNQIKDDDLASAFDSLLDFYALEQDSKNLSSSLNILLNPKGFQGQVAREAALRKAKWENMRDHIADDLEASIHARENSHFVRTLADKHNAFISEDDLQAMFESADEYSDVLLLMTETQALTYIATDVMPEEVYDVNTLKPIDKSSKRYIDIVKETKTYLESRWQKEEIVEEAEETPTPETAATPEPTTAPVTQAPLKPITQDTPFSEWPEELALAAENARNEHFDIIKSSKISDDAKKKALERYSDMNEFIKSDTGISMLASTISDYNLKNGRISEAEQNITYTTQGEQQPDIDISKAPEAEVIEASSPSDIPPPLTDYVTEAQKEVLKEAGIPEDGIIKEYIPEIDLDLPTRTSQLIAEGKITTFAIGMTGSETEYIRNALLASGQLKGVRFDQKAQPILRFKTTIKGEPYIVVYNSASAASTLGTKDEVAQMLGLPTVPDETNNIPVKTDSQTYFVSSTSMQLWLGLNNGKQHIFHIAKLSTPLTKEEEEARLKSTGDLGSWDIEITDRLSKATTKEELSNEYKKVINDNLDRQLNVLPAFTSEQLAEMYAEQLKRFPSQSKEYNIGENYKMKGKLANFGLAVINSIEDGGFVFKSHTTGELSQPISKKDLDSVIESQIMNIEEALENQKVNITAEEENIAKQNKQASTEALDEAAEASKLADEIDNMDDDQLDNLDDSFFDNLGCK